MGHLSHRSLDHYRVHADVQAADPGTMKVIVFNDKGVEMVTKCKEHDNAFTVTT